LRTVFGFWRKSGVDAKEEVCLPDKLFIKRYQTGGSNPGGNAKN
jgi:hypothetical protein